MKALVYTGPGEIIFRDEPDPVATDGEALVRIGAVGICGSDLHAYQGHDERRIAPLILGHEAAGKVVGGTMDGQNVVINPLVTCGKCRDCQDGRENLCADREIISMAPRQGALAEYVSVPLRNLIEVPGGLSLEKAALAEPIATGWHAVGVAATSTHWPLEDCRALVFGGGAVGLSAALSLRARGCSDIHLAETNPLRRETARNADFDDVFDPLSSNSNFENSADLIIDCVGGRATRMSASRAIRPGGTIVHVGLMDANDGLDVRKLTLQEVTFVGTYTYTMQDFRATMAAMVFGDLGDLDWFEERPLSDGADAFADLINGRAASAKIVLRPGG